MCANACGDGFQCDHCDNETPAEAPPHAVRWWFDGTNTSESQRHYCPKEDCVLLMRRMEAERAIKFVERELCHDRGVTRTPVITFGAMPSERDMV